MANGAIPLIFSASRVKQVQHLTRQVFKVEMTDGTDVIVKGEAAMAGRPGHGRAAVDFAYDAMRAVASGTKARSMDGMETREWFSLADFGSMDDEGKKELKRIAGDKDLRAAYVWMLVRFKEGLFSLQDVMDRDDSTEMVDLASALRRPENLERLGRMIAVDLFVDNRDRINYWRGYPENTDTRYFNNPDNVLFVRKDDGRTLLKALDMFHYGNDLAYIDTTVAKVKKVEFGGRVWIGQWLDRERELVRVTEIACEGFNQALLGHLVRANFRTSVIQQYRLRSKHRKIVLDHIKRARTELKGFARARMARLPGREPPSDGLQSRMRVLGWAK